VKRFVIAVATLASIVSACEADAPANAPARAECGSDANCVLGDWTADCCPRCKPFAAPISQVNTLDAKCRAMSPASARCPDLQCPPHEGPDYVAKCDTGRCVVVP
jgi:hypothetical protein